MYLYLHVTNMLRLDAHVVQDYPQCGIIVTDIGEVTFMAMSNFEVLCNLEYYDWPFDKQNCELILRITGTQTTPVQFDSAFNTTYVSIGNRSVYAYSLEFVAYLFIIVNN